MTYRLSNSWLSVAPGFLLVFPTFGMADDGKLPLSTKHSYVLSLYTGTKDSLEVKAVYCPVMNNNVVVGGLGMMKRCTNQEDFVIGGFGFGYQSIDHDDFVSGVPKFFIMRKKRPVFGRMVMNRQIGQITTYRAQGPVFYFDARPGIITVIPLKRQDSKEALDQARAAMVARGYGSEINKFKFELIRAAMVECGTVAGEKKCRLGEDIPYFKFVTIPIIIPM